MQGGRAAGRDMLCIVCCHATHPGSMRGGFVFLHLVCSPDEPKSDNGYPCLERSPFERMSKQTKHVNTIEESQGNVHNPLCPAFSLCYIFSISQALEVSLSPGIIVLYLLSPKYNNATE